MQQVEFQVGAKAARLIGRENIADVDGALIELIKNAYDADASCVFVDFFMPFPDVPDRVEGGLLAEHLSGEEMDVVRQCYDEQDGLWTKKENLSDEMQIILRQVFFSHNRIVVADNGSGMSLQTVQSAWMYIGTSNKESDFMTPKGRVKTGAKGIGRFALDKLSVKSEMYTKEETENEIVHWSMDWDQFANVRLISDVKAQIELCGETYQNVVESVLAEQEAAFTEHDWTSGTMIVLSPIREAWSSRLFRKVNANLKSINPIGSVDRFEVIVRNHYCPEMNFRTEKVAIDPEDYDYRIRAEYDGNRCLTIRLLRNEVDLTKRTITVEKYNAVRKKSVKEFWEREKLQQAGFRREDYDKEIVIQKDVMYLFPEDSLEKVQKVGPFSAEMYFLRNTNSDIAIMKKVAVRKRKKLLEQFSGIKLYRDDFKVRPYGDVGPLQDWLGLARRVQKSPASVSHLNGAWRVQPYQMIGLVKIGRESNPFLEDMANREGLALTDVYYIFVGMLQECIREFEFDRQFIYREYARWIDSIQNEMAGYAVRIKEEAVRRQEAGKNADQSGQSQDGEKGQSDSGGRKFSEEDVYNTVYQMMEESEKALNSKQILQIMSASGILMNTFFHEFNAFNTQFHVEAPQIRSRVNYILKGKEYEGIPAYNPYNRIDSLEKNDRLVAAFLDVIMDGLKKKNLAVQKIPLRKNIGDVLEKWKVLLEEKHISVRYEIEDEAALNDEIPIALVDVYIILNNVILNAVWFLEQEHNAGREISFLLKEENDRIYLFMEDNGPGLPEQFQNNPDKIFEIGETSKGEKGTGLGLWVVKETVERNDGVVSVMSKSDGFGLKISWKRSERRQ